MAALQARENVLEPPDVVAGEVAVEIGDRSPGALDRGQAVKEPGVVTAEAPSLEEPPTRFRIPPPLAPERVHPALVVGLRRATEGAARETERLDQFVAEDVGQTVGVSARS